MEDFLQVFLNEVPKRVQIKIGPSLLSIYLTLIWSTILHHKLICFISFHVHIFICYDNHYIWTFVLHISCSYIWFSCFVLRFKIKFAVVIVCFGFHVPWKALCFHKFWAHDNLNKVPIKVMFIIVLLNFVFFWKSCLHQERK
jgi:hypothetical protein